MEVNYERTEMIVIYPYKDKTVVTVKVRCTACSKVQAYDADYFDEAVKAFEKQGWTSKEFKWVCGDCYSKGQW